MKTNVSAPWTIWWQTDLPCEFSQERAVENCAYLVSLLGKEWLRTGITKPGPKNHPLLARWLENGAGAFLQLNLLAEDVRVLENIGGVEAVLGDLRDSALFFPTWHVLHSAALFERALKGTVVKFFPQNDRIVPDYLLSNGGKDVPVEAKLLTQSEPEGAFGRYGKKLCEELEHEVMNEQRVYPTLMVMCKNADALPLIPDVVQCAKQSFAQFKGQSVVVRGEAVNIRVESAPTTSSTLYRACFIYCPRSEKEDLRVVDRSKNASRQLRQYGLGGIACLGLSGYHDPHYVKALLEKRFVAGQFASIHGAILMRSGTHLEPPKRSVVDLLGTIKNPNHLSSGTFTLKMSTVGLVDNFFQAVEPELIPVYRVCFAETLVAADPGPQRVMIPDVQVLSPEAFA
jgi:hypothetical protein